jgi:hypothetical protein
MNEWRLMMATLESTLDTSNAQLELATLVVLSSCNKEFGIARGPSANEKLKNWSCMKEVWRHAIVLHGDAFRVIAIVSQL